MVKCTDNIDILARVAIVTDEETLLDTFVKTDLEVLDYGTEVRYNLNLTKCTMYMFSF